MKKLRSILSALATLRRVPSAAIAEAWDFIAETASLVEDEDRGGKVVPQASIDLIDNIIRAVIGIAKDDEDKAASPGKADKPAS